MTTPLRTRISAVCRRLSIGGLPVRDTTSPVLLRYLHRRLRQRRKTVVGFANHNFVVNCQSLRGRLSGNDAVVLVNDGIGMEIAALLRYGRGFRENMNGTDFTPLFLQEEPDHLKIYLIGGRPEVVAQAAAMIAAMPRREVVGVRDGYSLWQSEAEVIEDIKRVKPDVVLVGLGNPVQERWILDHMSELDVTIYFAIGALYEWMTGTRKRAPLFIRRWHLEWIYRLAIEPRRLAKRYTVDVLRFFGLVFADKAAREASGR